MNRQLLSNYPEERRQRDKWIVARRHGRSILDATRPYAYNVEEERSPDGEVVPVTTVFLTNRECPWRCLMCDLWKNTLTATVPKGAIPAQIKYALEALPMARQIKLYNSGSFFDPHAIPVEDYPAITQLLEPFDRVIVESHPALISQNCFNFQNLTAGRLEVAMGLETAHPQVLQRLNKGMTLSDFARAAETLAKKDIDLRVFLLVHPPFMRNEESLEWLRRSIGFSASCGATAITLIPARAGNGAIDHLATTGDFTPPSLTLLEEALEYGQSLAGCRVFVDLWEIDKLRVCQSCDDRRTERLRAMNLGQTLLPPVVCDTCGAC